MMRKDQRADDDSSTETVPLPLTATTEADGMKEKMNKWKLPDGSEDHIYLGLVKGAAGVVAGAAFGAVLFRSGKGWRTASMAMGAGVALGSTVERAKGKGNCY